MKDLVRIAERKVKLGLLSPEAIFPDGTPQLGLVSSSILDFTHKKIRGLVEVEFAADPVCLIKKEVIEKIGLMDESFSPISGESEDYSIRMRAAGFKLFRTSRVKVVHHSGKTAAMLEKDFIYFVRMKNYLLFSLLNLPVRYVFLRFLLQFLVIFLGTKETSFSGIYLRRDFAKRFFWFTRAVKFNLINLGAIIQKRKNRVMKIWY